VKTNVKQFSPFPRDAEEGLPEFGTGAHKHDCRCCAAWTSPTYTSTWGKWCRSHRPAGGTSTGRWRNRKRGKVHSENGKMLADMIKAAWISSRWILKRFDFNRSALAGWWRWTGDWSSKESRLSAVRFSGIVINTLSVDVGKLFLFITPSSV
jgi:hypothetical protein